MLKILIILILGTICTFGLQHADTYTCNGTSTCIPLSECEEIKKMLESELLVNCARSLFCGYFHEPYVCCDKNCITPNGNYGQILFLDDCLHLKAIEQGSDRRKKKFLEESYHNKTHVCCNKGEDAFKPVLSIPTENAEQSNPGNGIPEPLSSSCVTPNGEIAKCQHINDCKAYKEMAGETNHNFRFINDSFCGIWKEPMICCGDVSSYKENYVENLPDAKDCGVWDKTINPTIPPWLALIMEKESSKTCVGAVINQEYVLTTFECTGQDLKKLQIKIGGCINEETDCSFEVSELKKFPLHTYARTEDIGMVLLKLNQAIGIRDFKPVCLPTNELAIYQNIDVIGLEKTNSKWIGKTTSTVTEFNDLCHNAMKAYVERIVCVKERNLCSNTKRPLLQNFVLYNDNEDDRWYLEGLFNKVDCYGSNKDYFNAIYVYKFLPWIYSNLK